MPPKDITPISYTYSVSIAVCYDVYTIKRKMCMFLLCYVADAMKQDTITLCFCLTR